MGMTEEQFDAWWKELGIEFATFAEKSAARKGWNAAIAALPKPEAVEVTFKNIETDEWHKKTFYTEAPIAQPASAPSEQKPVACFKVYRGELCYRSQEDDQSYGMWCPVTQEYAPPFPKGTLFYTSPQPDYKAQRDALLKCLALIEPKLDFSRWENGQGEDIGKEINAAIALVKGGA